VAAAERTSSDRVAAMVREGLAAAYRRRLEDLRAADALQLAAGLIGSGEHPPTLPFVCADPRLNDAARKAGFRLPT